MERYVERLEDYQGPGRVDPLTGYIIEQSTANNPPITYNIDRLTGLPNVASHVEDIVNTEASETKDTTGEQEKNAWGKFRDGKGPYPWHLV